MARFFEYVAAVIAIIIIFAGASAVSGLFANKTAGMLIAFVLVCAVFLYVDHEAKKKQK